MLSSRTEASKETEAGQISEEAWTHLDAAHTALSDALQHMKLTVDPGVTFSFDTSAILRRRIGVVPVESDEQRPEGEALN